MNVSTCSPAAHRQIAGTACARSFLPGVRNRDSWRAQVVQLGTPCQKLMLRGVKLRANGRSRVKR
jgi:hypothetical protein